MTFALEWLLSKANFDFVGWIGLTLILLELKIIRHRLERHEEQIDKQSVVLNGLLTKYRRFEKEASHG